MSDSVFSLSDFWPWCGVGGVAPAGVGGAFADVGVVSGSRSFRSFLDYVAFRECGYFDNCDSTLSITRCIHVMGSDELMMWHSADKQVGFRP